jgi:type IV pilus assembly protein PilQ
VATLTKKATIVFWAILTISTLLAVAPCLAENENQESYHISALEWAQTANEFVLTIKGTTPPTYTMYELFNPSRIIIDIADATIDPSLDMSSGLPQGPVSRIEGQVLEDKEPFIARLEFFLSGDNSYTVDRLDNDIVVKFAKPEPAQTTDIADGAPPAETTAIAEESPPPMAEPAATASPTPANVIADSGQPAPQDESSQEATVLFDIEVVHSPTATKVFLKADGPIRDYTKEHLTGNIKADRPERMYIDVKNVKLAGPIQPKTVGTALAQIRTGARTDGFRVVFDSGLADLFEYEISEQDDGLLVTINEPSAATAVIAGLVDANDVADTGPEVAAEPQEMAPLEDETIAASQPSLPITEAEEPEAVLAVQEQTETGSALAFAGYTKQRITVDFYKIDLHNVFRLFGEISNLNMVVDSAVGGSLTLALNDVPWDFALDIILNLKDLQKEERFNTIVISPKSKKFEWPERTLETVEFKADAGFDIKQQEEEGIKVSKLQDIPETVVEAKNLIHQAQEREKLGNYTAALALYEEAFAKWPENTVIAKRITGLCLVHLGQNAKAVHYAKAALKADPNAYDSALQAAIGLARMQKTEQAEEYFKKSISGPTPSSAALASYAAFTEESQQFDEALALLKRHEDLHGDSLETMISKARIHDKQGQRDLASSEYQAILLSGYEIPPDLARYIKGRASLATQ